MGLFRSSVEFAVRIRGELPRAEGECVLQTEDEYCKYTLRPRYTIYYFPLSVGSQIFT